LDTQQLYRRNGNRSTVACQNGIVCASQPLATMVGIDVLKAGGSCVDAAIATNAMLGLTEPGSDGIGGDLFAIVWSQQDQRLFGLNASGRAPYEWNLERARERQLERIPRQSPLSWTVPGCVSGWAALNERFGKLDLARCLEPAIGYAEEGFPVSPVIATTQFGYWTEERFPHLAAVYHPEGKIPRFGDVFKNPFLAHTYRQIAEGGAGAFYEGEIAERIVAKSTELGGYMALRDLADHTADWVEPVTSSYMTAADSEGNMISLIQSVYSDFGSAICPDGVGFAMQNRGQAFSLDPEHANRLEPHKRPFHTIIPAFVTEGGRPLLSFGVMGGDFQPQGHVQVLMNMIDFRMSPQQAGDQPRVRHIGRTSPWLGRSDHTGEVAFEHDIPDSVKVSLAELGHQVSSGVGAHGGYQAIWRTDEPLVYFGGSDPRKDGAAMGY
jgi:gamma-glutamyltranspeptidase